METEKRRKYICHVYNKDLVYVNGRWQSVDCNEYKF